jgi:acyl-CoA thioesterase-1
VKRGLAAALVLGAALTGGCSGDRRVDSAPAAREPAVVLFFGDSITRGQGLDESAAFPAVVESKLGERGIEARCVNAGVSGDTTETALARLDKYVATRPDIVFVELGANDAFRGMNRARTRENLAKILRAFSGAGARLILAGTQFPHLQHPAYALSMARTYEELAESNGAEWIPDLMAGVASVRELNLADGVHPNAHGQQRLADTALPAVERALAKLD